MIAFGNPLTARVATLGLNPSRQEFLSPDGQMLPEAQRRLATHQSLGTGDLASAPREVVGRVFEECCGYFQRNPYRRWFDQLEPLVKACGASYYDGSGCHLDLVQWATDPTWARLPWTQSKRKLLADDAPFLVEQLRRENVKVLLVNGMGVLGHMARVVSAELRALEPIEGLRYQSTRVFSGTTQEGLKVIAWSTNMQSSHGVTTALRDRLRERVAEAMSDPEGSRYREV